MAEPDKPSGTPNPETNALKAERDQLEARRQAEAKEFEEEKIKQKAARALKESAVQTSEGLTNPDNPENKAGEIHQSYLNKVKAIDEKEVKIDRNKLFSSKLADIRFKNNLLVEDLKEETTKRLRALSSEFDNKWYTVDYQKIYEMTLGLGDILLDPDIENILVEKDGKIILGHRGVVPSGKKHQGRVGFLDENNNYIATYTGDKFKILSKNEKSLDEYQKAVQSEQKSREINRPSFEAETKALESYSAPYVAPEQIIKTFGKTEITTGLVEQATQSSRKGTRVKEFTDLESQNQPLAQVIRGVCLALGCREALIYATYLHESGFKGGKTFGDRHLKGGSVGIGQFRPGTWATISKDQEFRSYVNKHYPGQDFDRGENLLADIAASVVLLKRIARKGRIDLTQPLSTADVVYLRGGYNAGKGEPYRQSYLKTGTCRYMPFVYNYRRLEKGYMELINQKKESELGKGVFEAKLDQQKGPGRYFEEFKWGERKRPGVCDLASGQDTWIFGSSISYMMRGNTVGKTGVYGIGALDAPRFLQDLEGRWEGIVRAGVTPPKQVILLGLSMNGLRNKNGNPQSIARKEIAENMRIVNFLKSKGVTNVKIALEHSYSKNLGPIIAYNNLLKNEYPDQSVDYLHAVDSPKMHFSSKESRKLAIYFDSLDKNNKQTS